MIFMPETSDFITSSREQTLANAHSLTDSPFLAAIREAAKSSKISVSVGVHEAGTLPNRTFNTHVIVDQSGEVKAAYRKLHLFDIDVKGGPRLMESDIYQKGDAIIPPVETPVGKVGLSICYDLRFPMFATKLADDGADILTFPSAFTVKTGGAHWGELKYSRTWHLTIDRNFATCTSN